MRKHKSLHGAWAVLRNACVAGCLALGVMGVRADVIANADEEVVSAATTTITSLAKPVRFTNAGGCYVKIAAPSGAIDASFPILK